MRKEGMDKMKKLKPSNLIPLLIILVVMVTIASISIQRVYAKDSHAESSIVHRAS
jgi:hypothetical protein